MVPGPVQKSEEKGAYPFPPQVGYWPDYAEDSVETACSNLAKRFSSESRRTFSPASWSGPGWRLSSIRQKRLTPMAWDLRPWLRILPQPRPARQGQSPAAGLSLTGRLAWPQFPKRRPVPDPWPRGPVPSHPGIKSPPCSGESIGQSPWGLRPGPVPCLGPAGLHVHGPGHFPGPWPGLPCRAPDRVPVAPCRQDRFHPLLAC